MARIATESDFRTFKMAADSHFVKKNHKNTNIEKIKLRIDLKWPEMRSKVNLGHPKWRRWPFCKNLKKKFRIYLKCPEMRPKVIFRTSKKQNGHQQPFCKTMSQK